MVEFKLVSDFTPKGDQPQAIEKLTKGIYEGKKHQTLLGATGTGKTFVMARVIQNLNLPTLVMAPNKLLAAQLYQEFKEFFRFTVEYLQNEKGLDFLTAYSPDNRFNSEEEYLTWYPGDDIVDIIGVDNYGDFRQGSVNIEAVTRKLQIVVDYAQKTGKVAAFTETGLNKMTNDQWFTQKLGKSFLNDDKARKIAYVMLWRNDDTTHFFSAYPGHSSAPDFKKFTNHEKMWLLEDWNEYKERKDLEIK